MVEWDQGMDSGSTCGQSLLQGIPERLNVLPPAHKFVGSGGEIWFGKHVGPPKVTEVKVVKLTFLIFVTLVGLRGRRREYTPPTAERWKELRWVLLLVGGSPRGLVRSFGWESEDGSQRMRGR